MAADDLAWRAEQACCHGWPALDEARIGDWTARFGAGLTRRINSANPATPRPDDPTARLAEIEAAYHGWGLRTCVRLPSFLDSAFDTALERAGYAPEGDTITLYGEMSQVAAEPDRDVEVLAAPSMAWQDAKTVLSGFSPEDAEVFARVISRVAQPAGFAALKVEDRIVALAYGALNGGLLAVLAVVTDERERGRGFGRRMLQGLFDWAGRQGASGVCLQVEADNDAGMALYRRLGLTTELYRYHYRTRRGG
jgi:N-acetylglutamate synthase